jgi:tRNA1Val (adenine37-N6)-methyltransferase
MGAYLSVGEAQHVLDIGTGTGLLTLMLAQRFQTQFTAIEIDDLAYQQAQYNFQQSPWKTNITIKHEDINQFALNASTTFDYIICNPPFYSNALKSPDKQKNLAHHNDHLSQTQLLDCVKKLLTPTGKFSLLLPVPEALLFQQKAILAGLFLIDSLAIQHNANKTAFRRIDTYSLSPTPTHSHQQLVIRDENNAYSTAFIALLKDYYLAF